MNFSGTFKSRNARSGDNSLELELGASATRVHQIGTGPMRKACVSPNTADESLSRKTIKAHLVFHSQFLIKIVHFWFLIKIVDFWSSMVHLEDVTGLIPLKRRLLSR